MKVISDKNDYDYFIFESGLDSFKIEFINNLDLYWSCQMGDSLCKEILITKENYYVYELFEKLYIAIISNNPYYNSVDKIFNKKNFDKVNYRRLIKNNVITWYSDSEPINKADIFILSKKEDLFILKFKKRNMLSQDCLVRICNSGSRYRPFNISFMQMYKELVLCKDNSHQIHIEEYMYTKKLV